MAAALKNSTVMELDCTYNPLQTALLKEPLKVQNGTLIPPQGPGLGIELNPDALEKYQYSGEEDLSVREAPLRVLWVKQLKRMILGVISFAPKGVDHA